LHLNFYIIFRSNIFFALLAALPIVSIVKFDVHLFIARQQTLHDILHYLPYLFFCLSAPLGLKLNQSRIFIASLAFALCYHLLIYPESLRPIGLSVFDLKLILAFAFPIFSVITFTMNESRLMSVSGFLRCVFAFSPFVLVYSIHYYKLCFFGKILGWNKISGWLIGFYPGISVWTVPDLALLLAFAAVVFLIVFRDKSIRNFNQAFLWILIPAYYCFGSSLKSHALIITSIDFSAIGLIFLYSIFRLYWNKVYIDELTEIPNRRALNENIRNLRGTYTIGMIDIDHFKNFNDNYGHDAGDDALRFVAKHLESERRFRIFRYGGEEFCLIFEGRDPDIAEVIADKMRETLSKKIFYLRVAKAIREHTSKKDRGKVSRIPRRLKVTVSIGLASCNKKNRKSPEQVIAEADRALYAAKKRGRNQVVTH